MIMGCRLKEQGFRRGACLVKVGSRKEAACKATLRWIDGVPQRLIKSMHLSRPEHYFSIYQSGCNLSCRKCHSWYFSQIADGEWLSPEDVALAVRRYVEEYRIYKEPKERVTAFHATDLCKACGSCVLRGERSLLCPGVLSLEYIELSEQGWGPARNIAAFTGGDIACCPEFYGMTADAIKELCPGVWVLLETNGYGLTPQNLEYLQGRIDAFWLDIKAYDDRVHKKLTGVSNKRILELPAEIVDRGFVLEVLTLYIPGWVETDQIRRIAELLAEVDPKIPFTILAFFPEYKMRDVPPPTLAQMLEAFRAARDCGLKNIKLGNVGVFARTKEELNALIAEAGSNF